MLHACASYCLIMLLWELNLCKALRTGLAHVPSPATTAAAATTAATTTAAPWSSAALAWPPPLLPLGFPGIFHSSHYPQIMTFLL